MSFQLVIISPKGVYLDKEVESLTVKLTSGYRTILSHHADLIGALAYAPMHFVEKGKTYHFAIHGGAISIKANKVNLIVNAVEAKEEIDIKRAKDAKDRAEQLLAKKDSDINIDVKRAELSLLRALARIKTYEEDWYISKLKASKEAFL